MGELFEIVGKIAGLAGLCVGLALYVFRDLIAKLVFPNFPPKYAYKIIRLLILATSIIAITGMVLWATPTIIAGNNNLVIGR